MSNLTKLIPGTKYFIVAYATNSVGTSYGNQLSFTTEGISDVDGNVYTQVTIGTQTWLKENLKTTKYNDGTYIPLVTNASTWASLSTPGYCWYNNDAVTYKATYGALYNRYSITDKLCPESWHVPSSDEWETLATFLGGQRILPSNSYIVAGGKLKEAGTSHWTSPNTGTNESGFTALPGGCRDDSGSFCYIKDYGYWWTSSRRMWDWGLYGNIYIYMYYSSNDVSIGETPWFKEGFSVRCIKN
jgi:uncharacterized protein (TIGR02145 family)